MKNLINTFLLSFLIIGMSQAQKIDNTFFNNVNTFLSSHVTNGLVDYGQAKGNSKLASLIATIEKADLSGADEKTKKAFYINAYNLNVINQITKAYPTQSPMDITGFFDSKKVTVAGKKQTLNSLEKTICLNHMATRDFTSYLYVVL